MKIETVDAFYLSMPTVENIGDGSQDALLIRVQAGGFEGWGECEASPLPTIAALIAPMSHSACHPVLDSVLDQELNGIEDIPRIHRLVKMNSLDLLQADHALSGIDVALWDLFAQSRNVPVWSLLGKQNLPKRAYASQLFGDTPEETYESAKQSSAAGFTAAKFGWGPIGKGTLAEDEAQLEAAREALGPDRTLLVDTGCIFDHDVDRAATRIALMERVGAGWWEEPFAVGALREYSDLAARTSVKLAGGEGAHNVDQAKHLIDYGGVRFIQIDCGRIGGITPAREVASYAKEKGVSYVNHTFTSNLALSASLQPFADHPDALAEVPVAASTLAEAIGGPRWPLDPNGSVKAPEAPGLGVKINPKAIRPYLRKVEMKVNGFLAFESAEL